MQPFGNVVMTFTMTGDMIKRLLEQQFDNPKPGAAQMLQVSEGFTYRYRAERTTGPARRRRFDPDQRTPDRADGSDSGRGQRFSARRRRRVHGVRGRHRPAWPPAPISRRSSTISRRDRPLRPRRKPHRANRLRSRLGLCDLPLAAQISCRAGPFRIFEFETTFQQSGWNHAAALQDQLGLGPHQGGAESSIQRRERQTNGIPTRRAARA